MDNVDPIIKALQSSWTAETSYEPNEWTPDNPSRGQCVVSSLVIQDYFGGDIRRDKTVYHGRRESHYYCVLNDDTVVDTTREQYSEDVKFEETKIVLRGFKSVREKLLSHASTAHKYDILSNSVRTALSECIED